MLSTRWRYQCSGRCLLTIFPLRVYAVNAISLIIALGANLVYLAHMGSRISFSVAQPITIGGWYIASFLLIGLVAAAPSHLKLPAGEARTFSQAYYYAILAAAIYFVLASMLVVTVIGVYLRRYSRDVKLTFAQRTLMVQTMLFLGYMLASAAVYARIEGWEFLDAVYWVDVTVFTIGYGDFSPETHLGRSLFFPFAVGGILFIGLIIASVSSLALESGAKKVSIRMVEEARQQAIKKLDPATGTTQIGIHKRSADTTQSSELQRREQEFLLMRQVQQNAAWNNRLTALCVSVGAVVFLWFVGAAVFYVAERGSEDWSFFDALYFTYVSLLTIGYGDFSPQDNSAKPVFVFWSLLALPTLTVLIGSIGDAISGGVNAFTLWLSENLPDKGALSTLKGGAAKAKQDGTYEEAKPPGFMSDGKAEEATDDTMEVNAVKSIGGGLQNAENGGKDSAKQSGKSANTAKHYRRYLLMKEMKSVVEHMDASPPRQYTYQEWTWFLKLLGEDETDPAKHVMPQALKKSDSEFMAQAHSKKDNAAKVGSFSWLGSMSPLMGTIDEPKWVLQHLMATLETELKSEGQMQERHRAHNE